MQAVLDVVIFGCFTLSAAIPADGILLGFFLLTCTLVFQLASLPGRGQAKKPLPSQMLNVILLPPYPSDFQNT